MSENGSPEIRLSEDMRFTELHMMPHMHDHRALDDNFLHAMQVLHADVAKSRRVMVFCNTLDSCRATEHYLREKEVHTLCYHGDVPLDGRRQAIQEFTSEPGLDGQPVLVCTDLAARCVS